MLTGRDDLTADAVEDELSSRGASVVRYDTADFPLAVAIHARDEAAKLGW